MWNLDADTKVIRGDKLLCIDSYSRPLVMLNLCVECDLVWSSSGQYEQMNTKHKHHRILCRLHSVLRRVFRKRCWWWGWTLQIKSAWTSPMSTPGAAAWWLIRLCVDNGNSLQEGSPLLSRLLWCRLGEIQGEQGRGGGLLPIHV